MAVGDNPGQVGTGALSGGIGAGDLGGPADLSAGRVSPIARQRAIRTKRNLPASAPSSAPTDASPAAPAAPRGETLSIPVDVVLQPRGGISINGTRLDRLLTEMDVTNNRHLAADGFRATLDLVEDDPNFGFTFWSDADRIEVELFEGLGVEEPASTSVLSGRVDEIEISPDGRTVSLTGRDYTADLIERQTSEKYPNKTSSEIVTLLAQQAGLTPVVTETSTLSGTYYRAEHATLSDETTAWNLITYLAEREGFDAYVKGRELHFEPPPDPSTAKQLILEYEPPSAEQPFAEAPVSTFRFIRALTVSRDIVVRVISWGSGKKRAVEAVSRSKRPARSSNGKGLGSSGGQGAAVTHVIRRPNLTQEQADQLARKTAEDLAKHLRSFSASVPGVLGVDIRTMVTVKGTGGSFDTVYHLDVIQRTVSQAAGFRMSLSGRNKQSDHQASL